MIARSYKDVKIEINNSGVYCLNAELSNNTTFEPVVNVGERSAFRYTANTPPAGTVSLTYFITGSDPFANFPNEKTPFSVRMGGVSITSGYLKQYSVEALPNQPISASVQIDFFEKIEGDPIAGDFDDFTETPNNFVPLNVSDLTLVGGKTMKEESVIEMTYSYSCEIGAAYKVDGSAPNIFFGPQRVEVNASINDNDFAMLHTGIRENFKINLNDKNKNTLQSFVINGQIGTKSVQAAEGTSNLFTNINIGQLNLGVLDTEKTVITDFTPKAGDIRSTVELQGNNFVGVDKVLLGEFPCEIFGDYTSTSINTIVSKDIPSGYKAPFHVITRGMVASSHTGYLVESGQSYGLSF